MTSCQNKMAVFFVFVSLVPSDPWSVLVLVFWCFGTCVYEVSVWTHRPGSTFYSEDVVRGRPCVPLFLECLTKLNQSGAVLSNGVAVRWDGNEKIRLLSSGSEEVLLTRRRWNFSVVCCRAFYWQKLCSDISWVWNTDVWAEFNTTKLLIVPVTRTTLTCLTLMVEKRNCSREPAVVQMQRWGVDHSCSTSHGSSCEFKTGFGNSDHLSWSDFTNFTNYKPFCRSSCWKNKITLRYS